jgi:hypothetical protein
VVAGFSIHADKIDGKLGHVLIVAALPIEHNRLNVDAFSFSLTCRQLGSERRVCFSRPYDPNSTDGLVVKLPLGSADLRLWLPLLLAWCSKCRRECDLRSQRSWLGVFPRCPSLHNS